MAATDRRRINGPAAGTTAPVFACLLRDKDHPPLKRPSRTRQNNELRKIFLKTGLTPSASGSAYLELEPSAPSSQLSSLISTPSSLKISCAVHGPRPLPRSTPFTPNILLTTHIKFAPFAARQRRGYIRDASERDLAVHLETALRGVIIGDRWPKSGVDVIVTVLEGEEDRWVGDDPAGGTTGVGGGGAGWGMMNILAGCITVASAAIADAGIDCVDLVSGGVAALLKPRQGRGKGRERDAQGPQLILDPSPPEHQDIIACCVVGYLSSRDEITEVWIRGEIPDSDRGQQNGRPRQPVVEQLIDHAVNAASGARAVLGEAVKESAALKLGRSASASGKSAETIAGKGSGDIVMDD
ncbi:MAG: 3'-5'-exoribonuclease [Piccolia ochrophora]|nr:MAG: 3'-5'-exoribonuclease [Piccolia ochrophora]